MKITRKNNKLIIEVNTLQDAHDAIGEVVGKVPNLVGVICGDEQGIAHLSDRTYKGKGPDICMIFLHTYFEDKEFEENCKEWGIEFYKYPLCAYCKKPIYGCHTIGDKGLMCYDCEKLEEDIK